MVLSTRNDSGIGLESSILFASEGADVLLVDISLASAEKVVKIISERDRFLIQLKGHGNSSPFL